jgi:SAM-dependent methyltransferase
MEPAAMQPYGAALAAFYAGTADATLIVRRDDGLETPMPVSFFFRTSNQFTAIEAAALDLCRGSVLDVGAGSGLHSLVLQSRGHRVTALDINPDAVRILSERGVEDVRRGEVLRFEGDRFDTVLLLGHGIGMVENLAGLREFLLRAGDLVTPDGQVLIETVDVRATDDPVHLAYHEDRRRSGRYIGEIGLQFEFEGVAGPFCTWLHVDPDLLREYTGASGWACEVVKRGESGEYLARLTRKAGMDLP